MGFDSRQVFSFLRSVQTGSGTHPASYPMDTECSFPWVKRLYMKLTTHLHLVPKSRMVELYVHSNIYLVAGIAQSV
jgi:hypothetical protein